MMEKNLEMRKVFAREMDKYLATDPSIVYLDADLAKGIGTLGFYEKYPDRVFNVGVAEQNMVSIAAGLSAYGFHPFVTTFTPFASRRVCDQIAISCLYAQQNVKIVGSDPGISAETNGGTHMSMEDVGVLRSIPGLVIYEPADNAQLVAALPQILAYPGTMYIRLWRKRIADVFSEREAAAFDLFRTQTVKRGGDVTIFATGYLLGQSVEAAKLLSARGIDAEVVNVHTIKPVDAEGILESVRRTGCAVTAENHNVIGGLGSAVAEVLCEREPLPLERVGIKDRFGQVGDLNFLTEEYGLRAEDVAEAAERAFRRKIAKGRPGED